MSSYLVLGPNGVGKTTLIERIITGKFLQNNDEKVERSRSAFFRTSSGELHIIFHDINDIKDSPSDIDGIIILLDAIKPDYKTLKQNLEQSYSKMTDSKKIPIVICINKIDSKKIHLKSIYKALIWDEIRKLHPEIAIYQTSYKSNYNFEKPILFLARSIEKNPSLAF